MFTEWTEWMNGWMAEFSSNWLSDLKTTWAGGGKPQSPLLTHLPVIMSRNIDRCVSWVYIVYTGKTRYIQWRCVTVNTVNTVTVFSVLFLCSNDGSIRTAMNMAHSSSISSHLYTCICDALPQLIECGFHWINHSRRKELEVLVCKQRTIFIKILFS